MNFNNVDLADMAVEYFENHREEAQALLLIDTKSNDVDSILNKNCISELELIEWYAGEHGLIDSEDELSERFDAFFNEILDGMTFREGERLKNDEPAISEAFSSFADSLYSDGELHSEQVQEYCYTGEFND